MIAKNKQCPIPAFYNAANAASWEYSPSKAKLREAAQNWRTKHGVKPSGSDKTKLHLLLIDTQKDFCLPKGTLYVAGRSGTGAIDDSARMAEFIYRNLGYITDITTTLDTHFAYQIFSQAFWQDQEGKCATPFTSITTKDVREGRYAPNPMMASWLCNCNYAWLCKQVVHYCQELEKAGKYTLTIWPEHCILGSDGHPLVGIIEEARMFHSYVRGAQSNNEVKGGHPLTENYSVLRPEVLTRHDGQPLAQKNTAFIKTLISADAVAVGGQADSHCVASTIDDFLAEIVAQDPELAKKVYIMTDCMSAVTVPDGKGGFIADYTPQAEAAHKKFADAGMHLVKSTDAIESWPGIQL